MANDSKWSGTDLRMFLTGPLKGVSRSRYAEIARIINNEAAQAKIIEAALARVLHAHGDEAPYTTLTMVVEILKRAQ